MGRWKRVNATRNNREIVKGRVKGGESKDKAQIMGMGR
jgi:hypothetical protein